MSGPNWFLAMVEFRWTVKNLMAKFNVPRAVAKDIQESFPDYDDVCLIVAASHSLTTQLGH